jgi:hypothetical protein
VFAQITTFVKIKDLRHAAPSCGYPGYNESNNAKRQIFENDMLYKRNKMKKITLIIVQLLVLVIIISPQSLTQEVNDFKISTDNIPATFIQHTPRLLYTENKRFLTSWIDYREGAGYTYAQWFDSLGNSILSNFKINVNGKFAFHKKDYYLGIKESGFTTGIDAYLVNLSGNFYDNNNNRIIWRTIIDGIDVTLYETDWFEKGYDIACSSEDYIFCAAYRGNRYLSKYSTSGELKKHIPWSTYTFPISSSVHVNKNDEYILTYFNGSDNFNQSIFPPGIYASFYSKDDSIIAKDVVVEEFEDLEGNYWFNQSDLPSIKIVNVEDSLFQVFWIYKDSVDLNFAKFDSHGNRIGSTQQIILPHSDLAVNERRLIRNFTLSNFNNNQFALIISLSEGKSDSLRYSNTLFWFDDFGNIIYTKYDQSEFLSPGNQIFYFGDNNFFSVKEDSNDIFLLELNDFTITGQQKINDDQVGSSDINPQIVSIDAETNFVTWDTETKIIGQKVDWSGNLIEPLIELPGKNCAFADDGKCINSWKIRAANDLMQIGYSIFDKNWNLLKDTILNSSSDFYSLETSITKVNNTFFLKCIEYGKPTKIIALNNNFELIKEISFSGNQYTSLRIFKNDNESIWFGFSGVVQLYSNHLEPLSPEYKIFTHLYLGDQKFLYTLNTKPYSGYPIYARDEVIGRIITTLGEVIKNDFNLATDVDEYALAFLSNNDFLFVFVQNNKIFARVFSNEGIVRRDSTLIHSNIQSIRKQPSITLNENKVFFVWADTRNTDFGYDIYGSVLDIAAIVNVDKTELQEIPKIFFLFQNYPNPFNSTTKIKFTIPFVETGHVPSQLKVYDILGREIATLFNEEKPPGTYEVILDASNLFPKGSILTSGVYYYQLRNGGYIETKKMILLR